MNRHFRIIVISILSVISVLGVQSIHGRDTEEFTKGVQRIFDELDMTGLGGRRKGRFNNLSAVFRIPTAGYRHYSSRTTA